MQANSNPKKILIVEDDTTLRDILKNSLVEEGYTVIGTKTGQEGLKKSLLEHPDLILLDILLPDEDGLSILKKIRTDEAWGKNVKVVMLTNLSDKQNVAAALELGAHGFLVKSDWRIEDVIEMVHGELKDWPAES